MKPALIGLGAGAAAAAGVAAASRGPSLVEWPAKVRASFPFVLGGLAGAAVGLKVGVVSSLLRSVAGRGAGPVTSVAPVLVGAGVVAATAVVGKVAADRLIGRLTEQGRGLDPGFAASPLDPDVSAGPGSAVGLAELGREGARFVGTVSTPDGIRQVTGQEPVASPVRVFVGVDAAG
ncbi:MAG: hypothetical protein ACYC0W_11745, partial [Candidatus Nanopelagicales bacterium]